MMSPGPSSRPGWYPEGCGCCHSVPAGPVALVMEGVAVLVSGMLKSKSTMLVWVRVTVPMALARSASAMICVDSSPAEGACSSGAKLSSRAKRVESDPELSEVDSVASACALRY